MSCSSLVRTLLVGLRHFYGAVARQTVEDKMLNIGMRLLKHAIKCALKFVFGVESTRNNRKFHDISRLKMVMFKS